MPDRGIVHIVDDDEAVRKSLAFLLSSAGHAVRLYDSATAFLGDLSNSNGGCLITDIRMPEMTGIELLGVLKSKACTLPAIVITGHGDIPLAVEAMKAGAVDFIEKPFDDTAILTAVRSALERGAKGEGGDDAAIAARLEQARSVADVLLRRTRLGVLAAPQLRSAEAVRPVAEAIGAELGWSGRRVSSEAEAWLEAARAEGVDPASGVG